MMLIASLLLLLLFVCNINAQSTNKINDGLVEVDSGSGVYQGTTKIIAPGAMAFKCQMPASITYDVTVKDSTEWSTTPKFDVLFMTNTQWTNYKDATSSGASISLLAADVDKHMLTRRFGPPNYNGLMWVVLENGPNFGATPPFFSTITFEWKFLCVDSDSSGPTPEPTSGQTTTAGTTGSTESTTTTSTSTTQKTVTGNSIDPTAQQTTTQNQLTAQAKRQCTGEVLSGCIMALGCQAPQVAVCYCANPSLPNSVTAASCVDADQAPTTSNTANTPPTQGQTQSTVQQQTTATTTTAGGVSCAMQCTEACTAQNQIVDSCMCTPGTNQLQAFTCRNAEASSATSLGGSAALALLVVTMIAN